MDVSYYMGNKTAYTTSTYYGDSLVHYLIVWRDGSHKNFFENTTPFHGCRLRTLISPIKFCRILMFFVRSQHPSNNTVYFAEILMAAVPPDNGISNGLAGWQSAKLPYNFRAVSRVLTNNCNLIDQIACSNTFLYYFSTEQKSELF